MRSCDVSRLTPIEKGWREDLCIIRHRQGCSIFADQSTARYFVLKILSVDDAMLEKGCTGLERSP